MGHQMQLGTDDQTDMVIGKLFQQGTDSTAELVKIDLLSTVTQ